MNRQEFLFNLQTELSFLPLDERENALKYYDEYFEDAGKENEASVITELGSPAQAAQKIRKSLGSSRKNYSNVVDNDINSKKGNSTSVRTETGKIELKLVESIEALDDEDNNVFNKDYGFNISESESSKLTADKSENISNASASAPEAAKIEENIKKAENTKKETPEEPDKNENKNQEDTSFKPNHTNNYTRAPKRSASSIILTVMLLIFAAPILIPLLVSVFVAIISLFIGFFCAGIGFFCTSVAGIASTIGGVALVAYGLGMLFVNIMLAIGVIGQGLLAIGIGIVIAYIFFVLAKFTIKWSWKITCKILSVIGGAIRNLFAPRYNYNAA